jgi:hypothetical protein
MLMLQVLFLLHYVFAVPGNDFTSIVPSNPRFRCLRGRFSKNRSLKLRYHGSREQYMQNDSVVLFNELINSLRNH